MLIPWWLALQFLTRLPAPRMIDIESRQWGQSVLYYPVVGLLLGLLFSAGAGLLPEQALPLNSAAILALWVAITGGLHLDGLADSADAWLGGHGDKDKTLAIMKDPASGPAGITALVLALLLKYSAIYLLLKHQLLLAFLVAPWLGRNLVVLLFATTPYARDQGLGKALADHLPRKPAWILLALQALVAVAVLPLVLTVSLIPTLALFYLLRRLMLQRLQGTTGDTAGALIEIGEITFLCTAAWLQLTLFS